MNARPICIEFTEIRIVTCERGLKSAFCVVTQLNSEETRKFNFILIKFPKRKFSA